MPPPPRPARERFTDLLADEDVTAGTFSARRTARPDGLSLEVRGVGPIGLPVTIRQAKELVLVSRPAKFGKGEQTLVDAAVRDTWEVPRSRVTFDKRQWNATLRLILDKLRADLGLPDGCELATEFHAMLVYAPGQFFAPHQDSEKHDDMIGTLVVMLPSVAQGGTLVIEHGGVKENYRGSKDSLTLVAFYADCRHHVEPVTSGYRVVLTFNLLLRGRPGQPGRRPDGPPPGRGARRLHPGPLRWGGPDAAGLSTRPRIHRAWLELGPAQGQRRECRGGGAGGGGGGRL